METLHLPITPFTYRSRFFEVCFFVLGIWFGSYSRWQSEMKDVHITRMAYILFLNGFDTHVFNANRPKHDEEPLLTIACVDYLAFVSLSAALTYYTEDIHNEALYDRKQPPTFTFQEFAKAWSAWNCYKDMQAIVQVDFENDPVGMRNDMVKLIESVNYHLFRIEKNNPALQLGPPSCISESCSCDNVCTVIPQHTGETEDLQIFRCEGCLTYF